jgi:acyl-coenzyme A thioesterase PaaI-like protein
MSLLPVYRQSFFASQDRQDGMRLKMYWRRGTVYTDMSVGTAFEGYDHVVHGGMLFGILDVIMWHAIFMETKKICMTRKTDMDFLKPVLCNTLYRAQAKVLRVEDRDVWATGWIEDAGKERHAEVTALFREAKGLDYAAFIANLDFTGVSHDIREFYHSAIP